MAEAVMTFIEIVHLTEFKSLTEDLLNEGE